MEQNKYIEFDVICNDENILLNILNLYNSNYGTDFKIVNWIGGEIGFATIQTNKNTSLSDIFRLGFHFGVTEESLRNKGEIDW